MLSLRMYARAYASPLLHMAYWLLRAVRYAGHVGIRHDIFADTLAIRYRYITLTLRYDGHVIRAGLTPYSSATERDMMMKVAEVIEGVARWLRWRVVDKVTPLKIRHTTGATRLLLLLAERAKERYEHTLRCHDTP